ATLQRAGTEFLSSRHLWKDRRNFCHLAVALVIGAVLYGFSGGTINALPIITYSGCLEPCQASHHNPVDVRIWGPRALRIISPFSPCAQLEGAELSSKPAKWTGKEEDLASVEKEAHLDGRNLRCAQAPKAFLVKADLRHADLQGADLSHADMRRADLEE